MRKLFLPLVVATLGVITFAAAPVMANHTKTKALTAKVHHKHPHKKHKKA